MLKKSLILSALAVTLLFQACSDKKNDENSMIASNKFMVKDLSNQEHTVVKEGNNFTFDNVKGKVVLFDIFATWCPPCRAEASHLSSLQHKYKDDLIVAGISIQKDLAASEVVKFKNDNGADYMMLTSEDNRKLAFSIASTLEGLSADFPIPLMVMYKDGKLIKYYVGATPEEFIESDIKKALGK
ncbi:TlpA family protein disulfide reductase [Sulfurimonas sp. HSL-1716]|uniref:TlpA family protein disulfide reductase n=1 Tax=Hydrocurvibacter sulfurireducens TaxID=3131937 RepID=UPI0031F736B3